MLTSTVLPISIAHQEGLRDYLGGSISKAISCSTPAGKLLLPAPTRLRHGSNWLWLGHVYFTHSVFTDGVGIIADSRLYCHRSLPFLTCLWHRRQGRSHRSDFWQTLRPMFRAESGSMLASSTSSRDIITCHNYKINGESL